MPSFFSATSCSVLSARAFQSSSAFPFLPQNPRSLPSAFSKLLEFRCHRRSIKFKQNHEPIRTSYACVKLKETVEDIKQGKIRLDSWISSRIEGISRASSAVECKVRPRHRERPRLR
ncbi:hypothetical protein SLEP1_g28255 [Rubroshorea leprosula]|uniref:Uncharacterized protein n=1 Tax=Rubroshorea leprosula TaxID=152421 RepID=A0AAV5JT73_9ROSI|nr:hypothetical protein SLEP1_g28255 [Rubroshorea leprosula]